MRTNHRERSSSMYAAITIDDIVITDTLEFSLLVPSVYLGYRHIPTFGCGRAMYYDFIYFPHDFEKVFKNPLRCIPAAKGCDLTNVLKEKYENYLCLGGLLLRFFCCSLCCSLCDALVYVLSDRCLGNT